MAQVVQILQSAARMSQVLPLLRKIAETNERAVWTATIGLANKIARGEAIPIPAHSMTVRELGELWTSGRLAQAYRAHVKVKLTAKEDRRTFEMYVYPVAGDLPVTEFTADHAEQIMRRIPPNRAQNTMRNVAVKIHRLFVLAVYPLRLLTANPLPLGFLPRPGTRKAKVCIYPSEDRKLLSNGDIPLIRRLFYGFLIREGMRFGEASALRWADLDLDHGTVRLDTNKTEDARTWALDAGVHRALLKWKDFCGRSGRLPQRVFDGLNLRYGAGVFRSDLARSGVNRAELFEENKNRQKVRLHDLRASFVTIAMAQGKNEAWICARTGHRSSAMVATYLRPARMLTEMRLGALTPLDEAIPEFQKLRIISQTRRAPNLPELTTSETSDGKVEWFGTGSK
ncbi:MAG: tyrosine-type recombinase/integrase [Polyangiaceae bacterium]|nr:tyrosine-type recombinase/integrase [Polyangiaceae bacterium]